MTVSKLKVQKAILESQAKAKNVVNDEGFVGRRNSVRER